MAPDSDRADDTNPAHLVCGDSIDSSTFEQILEMDDDENREFSRELVYGYFEQATSTLEKMDEALHEKNLLSLSHLGHYLKGSSATLGLTKVRDQCEKIQHLGAGKAENGDPGSYDDKTLLKKIGSTLVTLKEDCEDAEQRLRVFYDNLH